MGQEGRVPRFDRLFRAGWSIVQRAYVANHVGLGLRQPALLGGVPLLQLIDRE